MAEKISKHRSVDEVWNSGDLKPNDFDGLQHSTEAYSNEVDKADALLEEAQAAQPEQPERVQEARDAVESALSESKAYLDKNEDKIIPYAEVLMAADLDKKSK